MRRRLIKFKRGKENILNLDSHHKIIFDDFRNVNLKVKADMIFADPPFGIDFMSNLGTYHRKPDALSYIEIPRVDYPNFIHSLLKWSHNVLKDNGSMWLVSGWNNLGVILSAIDQTNFLLLNHCIWKYQFGVYTKRRFTTSHYHLLLLVKNEKRYIFNKPEHYAEDVWDIKRTYQHGVKTAGNELPDELVERCVYTSTNKGDFVIDPVIGSGTTMRVCCKMGRRCIGIEKNSKISSRIKTKLGLKN